VTLLGFVTPLIAEPAGAQVDVQPLTQDLPGEGWSGTVTADFTVQTGNTDLVQLGLAGRTFQVKGNVTTLIVGNGGLGFLSGDRFASSGLVHYRRTHRVTPWIRPEWYVQANYDRQQLLEFRSLLGAGFRTPVTAGDWGEFAAGTSIMIEDERLDLDATASHPTSTTGIRWSTLVSLRWTPSSLVLTSTAYAQPRVDDLGDIRILQNLSVAAPVSERVALSLTFDLRFDSGPPDGLSAVDATLRTGVTLTY